MWRRVYPAMQAMRRGDKPHLRTRFEKGGMNYKGYNIAIHEMGHNVEQVFSLYDVDHTLLSGVPNTAFTEALAFVFQARDLELLGVYSHMVNLMIYLPDYPLGHFIAFQIEEQVKKGKSLGEEFERMTTYGSVTPDLWM